MAVTPERWPLPSLIFGLATAVLGPIVPARADDEGAGREAQGGTVRVEGVVIYDGPLPEPVPVPEAGAVRRLIEVEPETRGLRDAVVWLEGAPARARPGPEAPEEPAVMDQQNYFFVPHVLAVEAGRVVEFRNSDVANHGVTASSLEPGNRCNVVTPQGGKYAHRFVGSKSPVAIGCPIHAAMAAWVYYGLEMKPAHSRGRLCHRSCGPAAPGWRRSQVESVYVFDHPYFAVTDGRGGFRLPPVPPGRYTLRVRHPDGGLRRQEEVVVRAGEPVRLRIDFHGHDLKLPGRAGKPPGAERR